LNQCWFDNIDFITKYSKDFKEGFNLALERKDFRKIKDWAIHEAKKKNRTIIVTIFYLSPIFLYGILVQLFLMIRLLRKSRRSG
jgi:hypothetical protein